MTSRWGILGSILVALTLAACSSSSHGEDDAGTADAGQDDAGTADAGQDDAGTADAGQDDAGTADAGTLKKFGEVCRSNEECETNFCIRTDCEGRDAKCANRPSPCGSAYSSFCQTNSDCCSGLTCETNRHCHQPAIRTCYPPPP